MKRSSQSRWIVLCAAAVLILAALPLLYAQSDNGGPTVRAFLNGWQEVPSISTTGSGDFVAKIGDDTITYELSYANLEGTAFQAHIHLGQRTANGGVSVFLCGGGDKPPCPATGGTVSGVIDPSDVIGPANQGIAAGEFDELVRAIRNGNTYANVHTNKHPGGEIRGQIRNDGDPKD